MMSTEHSERFFERARRIAPGGVHSPVRAFKGVGGSPRFVRSARGAELTDVDGNEYVDYCLSWGPLIFGHRDEETLAAVNEALSRGWSYGAAEPYSLELAELIVSRIPWVDRVRFVSSGTEAVMSALRVARAATGRAKILKFDGCYHGHADSMLVRAGSGLAEMASPDSAGVTPGAAADTIVVPLDDEKALGEAFARHGSEIAAVIVEPVPANNGLLPHRDGFLDNLARLARSHGALVIFDEVITGFRVAFGGMADVCGVRPDLVTYGKILGGGFPVGAYGGRSDLMALVAPEGPVYQAGTLSANPVAVAAGLATLRKLVRENPYAKLAAETERLASRIETAARRSSPVPVSVQRFASMFWICLGETNGTVRRIESIPASQREIFPKLFHFLLERGFYLAPSGFEVGFLSTAHDRSTNDELAEAVGEAFVALSEGAPR